MKSAIVSVTLLAFVSTVGAATIIPVPNGDFQAGSFTGWQTVGASVYCNNGQGATWTTGDYGAHIKSAGYTDPCLRSVWLQGVKGDSYTLEFDAAVNNTTAVNNMVYVEDSNQAQMATGNIWQAGYAATSVYYHQSIPFVNTSANGMMMINIQTSSGSTHDFWIDNIQILPEPVTMSLLGLGLVGLLRRRR